VSGRRIAALAAANVPRPPVRDEFFEDFTTDVMPYIEKSYRVLAGQSNRAIADLQGKPPGAYLDQLAQLPQRVRAAVVPVTAEAITSEERGDGG